MQQNCTGLRSFLYSHHLLDDICPFEDILRHMAHIADKAGIEAVALGSDFDGIDCTLELKDYGGLVPLAERIADRFGADDAERICSGNALRVLRDTIG